ncbi:conserved Plasmodium protein, unknown function [Plasmodium ovale]|uniref:Uncharacterized protein n=1 Tax=Plasmodium ovale TaxID=36330 RepID=A0A1C3KS47_PLAOA|nr:conserved Plasmodium protein, unknown function [Plasmodium ovale]
MAMNALYNSRLWKGITRGTKGILQSEKLHMFRNSERRDLGNNKVHEKWKKCKKTGGKGYPEEEYTGTFIEKEVLPSGKEFEEKVFKKMKIYYVDKNLFFIFGCFTSLYSVFVYDFFTNRYLQISSNFFFFIFHITKQTVNMLACVVHLLFICFQVLALSIKANTGSRP